MMWKVIELEPHADGSISLLRIDLTTAIYAYFEKERIALRQTYSKYYGGLVADMPIGWNPSAWLVGKWKRRAQ